MNKSFLNPPQSPLFPQQIQTSEPTMYKGFFLAGFAIYIAKPNQNCFSLYVMAK